MKKTLEKRIAALEGKSTVSRFGVRQVSAEEIERFWTEEWDPGWRNPYRHGVALVPRTLSFSEWEAKYGSIEIEVDSQSGASRG